MSAAIALQTGELDRSIGAIVFEVFTFLCRLIMTLAFMSPAVALNVASLESRGWVMCLASVVLIFGAAFAVHCTIHRKAFGERAFFLLMAPVLVFMSMFTAIRNVGGIRETAAVERKAHTDAEEGLKGKITGLETRRKAQVDVAGEVSLEVIDARIEALKAQNLNRWNATDGCKADQVW